MLAFSLSRRDYREYDQQISFYTKEAGKLEIVARGVKKSIAKNAPSLEPFSVLDIEIVPGKNFSYVTKAQIKKPLLNIRKTYKNISIGGAAIGLIDKVVEPGVKDEKIFNLLFNFLSYLDRKTDSERIIFSAFILKLLGLLGFSPDLSGCAKCKKSVTKKGYFDVSEGVIFCEKCGTKGEVVDIGQIENLKMMQNVDWEKINGIKDEFLLELVRKYAEYHLTQKIPVLSTT